MSDYIYGLNMLGKDESRALGTIAQPIDRRINGDDQGGIPCVFGASYQRKRQFSGCLEIQLKPFVLAQFCGNVLQ